MSVAGLMTQVLPETSAGKSFQTGNGHGEVPRRDQADDAHRHAHAHGEFVLQLAGGGLAEEAAAFAGHVEGLVDGFLHVAAGFGQHLAHFAGHVAGDTAPCAAADRLPARTRISARLGAGTRRQVAKAFLAAATAWATSSAPEDGKRANDVGVVGRVHVENGFAACGGQPFAADQIVICGIGHGRSLEIRVRDQWSRDQ